MLTSTNPFTQQVTGEYPEHTIAEVQSFLSESQEAFSTWSHMSFSERRWHIAAVWELLRSRREELARISTEEMGMLYRDALWDIDKSIANIVYFSEHAETLLSPKKYNTGEVVYEPLGALLVIAPWNFPYNQWLRNVIPQLMAGNVVVLKHASNLPRTSLALQKIFDDAGVPRGVFRALLLPGKETETLIADNRIIGVSITSGEQAGRAVAITAGKYLKPCVLELGWNDACIVLPDARADEAVTTVMKWRMANGGQKCNAIKRLILVGDRSDIVSALIQGFESFTLGDPLDADTTLPPLVDARSVADIAHRVEVAVQEGALILTGGEMVTLGDVSRPQFYAPTLLTHVDKKNSVYDYEFFWPVLLIYTVQTVDEAISLANDSQYGLGCVILWHDTHIIEQCITNIHVGNIALNQPVTSYPHLPYGWIKNSGYGRELGEQGIKAFMNVKTIVR